jgi:CdiI immunity protein
MSRAHDFDPKDFPHLREFARGYLHQDAIAEYGSAEEAAKAYVNDLSGESRKAVAREVNRFRFATRGRAVEELREAFAILGAAWALKSEEDARLVLETLGGGVKHDG